MARVKIKQMVKILLLIAITASLFSFKGKQEMPPYMAVARFDCKYGIIDIKGNWYIKNEYKEIRTISENYAHAITNDNTEGFIYLPAKLFIPMDKWEGGTAIKGYEPLTVFDYVHIMQCKVKSSGDTLFCLADSSLYNSRFVEIIKTDSIAKYNYSFAHGIAPVWIEEESSPKGLYKKGKWMLINKNGDILKDPVYSGIQYPFDDALAVSEGNKSFFLDTNLQLLFNKKFDDASPFSEGLACVGVGDSTVLVDGVSFRIKKGKSGYINRKGKTVVGFDYEFGGPFSCGLAVVKKNGKYGYINKKNKVVIPFIYEHAWKFSDGVGLVYSGREWGIINKKWELVKEPIFDYIGRFQNGIAAAMFQRKWGFINTKGEWLIEPIYESVLDFVDPNQQNCMDCLNKKNILPPDKDSGLMAGINLPKINKKEVLPLSVVKLNGKYGIVDAEGDWFIKNIYQEISGISENFAFAVKDTSIGYIYLPAKLFIPHYQWGKGIPVKGYENFRVFDYVHIMQYKSILGRDTLYCVADSSLYNNNYLEIIRVDSITKYMHTFQHGIAPVWVSENGPRSTGLYEDGKAMLINKKGDVLKGPVYSYIQHPFDEAIMVSEGNKFFFLDTNMQQLNNKKYDGAYPFSEGLACVGFGCSIQWTDVDYFSVENGKWGYIDLKGKTVVGFDYDYGEAFSEGLAAVKKDGKWGYIDLKGKIVVGFEFDYGNSFSEGLAAVKKDGKYGFINKDNKVVVPFEYDYGSSFSEGLAAVEKDGKCGYIDLKGKIMIGFEYDYGGSFNEGLAAVEKEGKFGFINKDNKVIVPFKFDYVRGFSNDIVRLILKDKWGLEGIKEAEYDLIWQFRNDIARVKSQGKYGAINRKGEWITVFVFETMDDFVFPYERNYIYWINKRTIFLEIPDNDPCLMDYIDY